MFLFQREKIWQSAFRTVTQEHNQVAEEFGSKYSFVAAPDVRSVERMMEHVDIATAKYGKRCTNGVVTTRWASTFSG